MMIIPNWFLDVVQQNYKYVAGGFSCFVPMLF